MALLPYNIFMFMHNLSWFPFLGRRDYFPLGSHIICSDKVHVKGVPFRMVISQKGYVSRWLGFKVATMKKK